VDLFARRFSLLAVSKLSALAVADRSAVFLCILGKQQWKEVTCEPKTLPAAMIL